jgi:hypothetical protein
LFFPPPEEKQFYESEDGSTPPFQAMMALLPTLKQYRAHLKQEGKQLKLNAVLPGVADTRGLIASARALLAALGAETANQPPEIIGPSSNEPSR